MAEFFYTEPQAATELSISVRTLSRWRKSGAVSYSLTPGGRIRYSLEDMRRLILAMKVDTELGPPPAR